MAVVAGYQVSLPGSNAADGVVVRQGNADANTVWLSNRAGDIGSDVISRHKIGRSFRQPDAAAVHK